MSLFKKIFGTKDMPISSYDDFWDWFQQNKKPFFKAVQQRETIEADFLDKIHPKLVQLKDGFFYLAGMFSDDVAELVFSADGNIKNIVFVEEIVASAPPIDGWKITAFKAANTDNSIEMAGYRFSGDNMSFYANESEEFPDEIDITIVYDDYNEEDKSTITNGSYIFLDNFLGELNFATIIDSVTVIGKGDAQEELVPIKKLPSFLLWRQKEFVEKYDGLRRDTESDNYSVMEAELQSGNMLLAVVNSDLLTWDRKASHPWILEVEIKFDKADENNGLPDEETFHLLSEIEDQILAELKDFEGYLNIGRQTADGVREIYFACKDFRKPSKVIYDIEQKYRNTLKLSYDIYKDKYWKSFNRFMQN